MSGYRSQQAHAYIHHDQTRPCVPQLRIVRTAPITLMFYIGRGREFRCGECRTTTIATRRQLIEYARYGGTTITCRTCGKMGKAVVRSTTQEDQTMDG